MTADAKLLADEIENKPFQWPFSAAEKALIVDALRRYVSRPYINDTTLTEEELLNLRPGPIQVVYPLDEEWNAALNVAAQIADTYRGVQDAAGPIADGIRALKRKTISVGGDSDG